MYILDRLNEFSVSKSSMLRIAIPAIRVGQRPVPEVVTTNDELRNQISKDLKSFMRSERAVNRCDTQGLSSRAREALYGDVA